MVFDNALHLIILCQYLLFLYNASSHVYKLSEDLVLKSNQKQEKMFYMLKSFCCIKYYI